MVDAAHPLPRGRCPLDAVVERARPEHRRHPGHEDRGSHPGSATVGHDDERNGGDQRAVERPLVRDAAQPRPGQRFGGDLSHRRGV